MIKARDVPILWGVASTAVLASFASVGIVDLMACETVLRRRLILLIHVATGARGVDVVPYEREFRFVVIESYPGPSLGRVTGCTISTHIAAMCIVFLVAVKACRWRIAVRSIRFMA